MTFLIYKHKSPLNAAIISKIIQDFILQLPPTSYYRKYFSQSNKALADLPEPTNAHNFFVLKGGFLPVSSHKP